MWQCCCSGMSMLSTSACILVAICISRWSTSSKGCLHRTSAVSLMLENTAPTSSDRADSCWPQLPIGDNWGGLPCKSPSDFQMAAYHTAPYLI